MGERERKKAGTGWKAEGEGGGRPRARAEGEKVVWTDDAGSVSLWCSELLDDMMLD